MRRLTHWLQAWWWSRSHPLWDELEPDVTTPLGIADWIARHKHPAGCAGGCRCELGGDTS